MDLDRIAWIVRTVMVATAAICTYLLVQDEVQLEPWVRLIAGAINVALAAINPTTLASKFGGSSS